MDIFEYYEFGYNNTALEFAYIPEFNGDKRNISAYALGCVDGREGVKKDVEDIERIVNQVNRTKN